MTAAPPLLEVSGLAKRYGGSTVFEGVDLRVAAGEFVAILGESGVGKSTLLNCIAGLDTVDAGCVRIAVNGAGGAGGAGSAGGPRGASDSRGASGPRGASDPRGAPHDIGTEITALGEAAQALFRRAHLGFVFQAFHVLPHLSVAHNVGLPLLLQGRGDADRVQAVLKAVGLEGLGARLPQTLSGGQLQRVAIARALVHRPPLILADEPTGNLDPATAERVMDLLSAQVRGERAACVLVTHSRASAARADRVLTLTAGGMQGAAG